MSQKDYTEKEIEEARREYEACGNRTGILPKVTGWCQYVRGLIAEVAGSLPDSAAYYANAAQAQEAWKSRHGVEIQDFPEGYDVRIQLADPLEREDVEELCGVNDLLNVEYWAECRQLGVRLPKGPLGFAILELGAGKYGFGLRRRNWGMLA